MRRSRNRQVTTARVIASAKPEARSNLFPRARTFYFVPTGLYIVFCFVLPISGPYGTELSILRPHKILVGNQGALKGERE